MPVMYGQQLLQFIRARAQQLGLDPNAVESVLQHEGGLQGSVGDHGTSFGPFQLHEGGALPQGLPDPRTWANTPAGINYALSRIASVAKGQTGQQAVTSIVTDFEKPADPASEIAKALQTYQGLGGRQLGPRPMGLAPTGGAAPGGAAPGGPPGARPLPTAGVGAQLNAADIQRALGQAMSQIGLNTIQSGQIDSGGLMQLAQMRMQLQAAEQATGSAPAAPTAPRGGAKPSGSAPTGSGSLVAPAAGKIIGTPYQGTHAKDFNIRGGSNNWESENAIDIALPVGTPLRAIADGRIGQQFGSLGSGGRFAGLRLHLVVPGNEYYYAHLSRFAPGIRPGVRVKAGQIIGYSGSANGTAHLHLGARNGDPTTLYGAHG